MPMAEQMRLQLKPTERMINTQRAIRLLYPAASQRVMGIRLRVGQKALTLLQQHINLAVLVWYRQHRFRDIMVAL